MGPDRVKHFPKKRAVRTKRQQRDRSHWHTAELQRNGVLQERAFLARLRSANQAIADRRWAELRALRIAAKLLRVTEPVMAR